MSITFLSNPIHLPEFFKFDREYLGKQESQNEDQKVFHKDTLEVSQLSKNRENLMDKIKHTVVHSVTSFSDMRAGILKEIREEKGQYDYTDVVNACGLSYARLYSEIEERYKNGNEQYYKSAGGTPWTKEEIEWLDMQYEPGDRSFRGIFLKCQQKRLKNWRTAFIRRRMPTSSYIKKANRQVSFLFCKIIC